MTLMGLPLHPVFVHFGVVFILVFALVQLIALFSQRFVRRLDWLLPVGGILTAVFALLTKQTGEMLGHVTHDVNWHPHGEWGDKAAIFGVLLGGFSVLLWFMSLRSVERLPFAQALGALHRKLQAPLMLRIIQVLTGLVCLAAIVFVMLAGHTGAALVWNQ